jgi:hypothetical protein
VAFAVSSGIGQTTCGMDDWPAKSGIVLTKIVRDIAGSTDRDHSVLNGHRGAARAANGICDPIL